MTTETNSEAKSGETVMDAINEALGLGSSENAPDTNAADTGAEDSGDLLETGNDTDAADGADEADPGNEQGGDGAGGDKPPVQGAKPAEGADKSGDKPTYAALVAEATKLGVSQRHADGRIKSAAEITAEVAAKKAAGEDGKGGASAAKKADPLNDPIPKDLKPETNQRIRSLIGMAKEATDKATQAEGNFNQIVSGLQAAQVSPEQFGETVSFLALFNSNDPKQQGQALEIIEDMADKLATFLGRERRSSDPVEKHPDLLAAVQKREITPQLAREMARNRNQGAFRGELHNAALTAQQRETAATQERETARNDLNTLEAQLQANDPLYARKKAAIVPALKASFKHIPPSKWKAAFQEAYNDVKLAPVAQRKPIVPVQQPMRGGRAPAGSGAAANGATGGNTGGPQSMREAIDAALSGR